METALSPRSAYDKAPLALIFSDSDAGGQAAASAVTSAGGRIAAIIGIGEAVGRLDDQAMTNAILLDVSRDHGPALDRLLDRIDHIARHDAVPAIISAPFNLIDIVSARLGADQAVILCEPDPTDRVATLACAWAARPAMFNDIGAEVEGVRLKRLADEVSRIARTLASLAAVREATNPGFDITPGQFNAVRTPFTPEPASLTSTAPPEASEIRAMLRLRRLRANFFTPELFADPAWDMLLDLMAARIEDEQVAVSSLCIAAAVPPTTALRWIKTMTDFGLFERHADPLDGRRIFIRLSNNAAQAMAAYLAAAKRMGGMAS